MDSFERSVLIVLNENESTKKTVVKGINSVFGFVDLTSVGKCLDFEPRNLFGRKMSILMSSTMLGSGGGRIDPGDVSEETPPFDILQCSTGAIQLVCDKGCVYRLFDGAKRSLVGKGYLTYLPEFGAVRVNVELARESVGTYSSALASA